MVRILFTQADGAKREIDAEIGETLMECARAKGVDGIIAECGGSMVCGTCHVFVAEPWFSAIGPATEMETDILDYGLHRQSNSRLSCQIEVTEALDGIEIGVPASQR